MRWRMPMRGSRFITAIAMLLSCSNPGTPDPPRNRYPRGYVHGEVSDQAGNPIVDLRVDAEVFGRADLVHDCEGSVFSGAVGATSDTDAGGRFELLIQWAPSPFPVEICLGVRTRPRSESEFLEVTKTGILLTVRREVPWDSVRVDLVAAKKDGN